MNRRMLSIAMLLPFLALTAWSLLNGGIMGILNTHQTPGGRQVFVDLIISLILLMTFLVPHARSQNRNPWIWVALTVVLGSIAPMLYFATASPSAAAQPS